MDATDIVTGLAKDTASTIIAAVAKQIKDVVELEENLELLNTDFTRMEGFLRYIDKQFQEQQRRLPEPVELCLTRMNQALTQAKRLVESAKRQRRRCFGCCLLCNPKLTTEVRNWERRFDRLFQELQNDFSTTANIQHIVSNAAPQAEVLLQDVPDDIVGSTIYSAQMKLQTWLTEPAHCVIGIHGMGGVGKEKVSGVFDVVIWCTVSEYKNEGEDDKIKELQISIAQTLNLDLKDSHTPDMRKMKLSAYLENKRFLIILDDMWRFIDLNKIGVKFGHDKGSKVLISSRSSDVIRSMGANDYSFKMQPLSEKDGRLNIEIRMEDLRNLSNLMELSIPMTADTMGNCDCTWSEMRKLTLVYDDYGQYDPYDHVDVGEDAEMSVNILPSNMETMIKLQSLILVGYPEESLPNYISKFQNLETLKLFRCDQLRELPLLEIGSDSARDNFPMLKWLELSGLEELENITGVLTMSKLQSVEIMCCPLLKRLPMGMEKLYNLQKIKGEEEWWSNLIWEAEVTRVKLEGLFVTVGFRDV